MLPKFKVGDRVLVIHEHLCQMYSTHSSSYIEGVVIETESSQDISGECTHHIYRVERDTGTWLHPLTTFGAPPPVAMPLGMRWIDERYLIPYTDDPMVYAAHLHNATKAEKHNGNVG